MNIICIDKIYEVETNETQAETSLLTSPIFFILLKKLYDPFLWLGHNCLKGTEPLRWDSLLLVTKSSEIPGTHLIDLKKMTG